MLVSESSLANLAANQATCLLTRKTVARVLEQAAEDSCTFPKYT